MKNLKQLIRQAVPMVMMLLLCSATLQAQNIAVSGTVSDAAGEPLIGASVVVRDKLPWVQLLTLMVISH